MNVLLQIFLLLEAAYEPINNSTATGDLASWLLKIVIASIVAGIIIGLIGVTRLKSQLTSVFKNDSAADYTKENSFKVEQRKEIFLYSKTEKEEKPKDNNSQQ